MSPAPAVFLDRDGTLMLDVHFASRPEDVELVAGAAEAVRRLSAAGVKAVVVTNQSGIGRGYFGTDDYEKVTARFDELLRARGAVIDAYYMCPHAPGDGCGCRKPGVELFVRAIDDLRLDRTRLGFVGDRLRDVAPADFFPGSTAALVASAMTPPEEVQEAAARGLRVDSMEAALDRLLASY